MLTLLTLWHFAPNVCLATDYDARSANEPQVFAALVVILWSRDIHPTNLFVAQPPCILEIRMLTIITPPPSGNQTCITGSEFKPVCTLMDTRI
jgi:hypothetical protein